MALLLSTNLIMTIKNENKQNQRNNVYNMS